ncbi:hypothetical protein AB0D32_26085 [Micromonospora sp. NPDC048170]|uniref:hypothetical protein n=1 Tax=Micromonospora sp. NPDC048170 TaxID=3154819 RepID=UPI0033FC626D
MAGFEPTTSSYRRKDQASMSAASSRGELPEQSTIVRGCPASAALVVTHLLGTRTIPISEQASEEVQRSTISGSRSLSQILQPASLVEQPVQPPARVRIMLAESRQLEMTPGASKQIHVPKVCIMALMVGAVALRNSLDHRDCSVPVAPLLGDACCLRPVSHGSTSLIGHYETAGAPPGPLP